MLEYIHAICSYTFWANQRILDACEKLDASQLEAPTHNGYANLRATLVHTLNGNWIWLSRWHGISPTRALDPQDFPTLASIRSRWQQEEEQMRAFLATLTPEGLHRALTYKNLKGMTCTLPLWQTIIHVVNHGTQHRSEVAFMLTALDCSPGDLDMSLYFTSQLH